MKNLTRSNSGTLKKTNGLRGVTLIFGFTLLLVGCSANQPKGYVDDYRSAVESYRGLGNAITSKPDGAQAQVLNNFKHLFANLKSADIASVVNDVYAQDLYFNDTFHTIRSRDQLTHYLIETSKKLEYSHVTFTEMAVSNNSYFLSWEMHIEFSASGSKVNTKSIGVSQIRFNEQGQITFHQDFWDNTQGFFGHLPVFGYLINKVRGQL